MYKYVLILFFSACCISAEQSVAQAITPFDSANVQGETYKEEFKYVRFIPGDFSRMEVDILDNIYVITAGGQLKKINANGDSAGIYNDVKQFGTPSGLDVSNPLKILVYYKNFSTVIVLDRFLTYRNSINFRKENLFGIKAIAASYDNNIWIYDERDQKLKKIDDDGKVLRETSDLRQIFEAVPRPVKIIDNENAVYLYDEEKGFFIFDYYGSFKNILPFKNWTNTGVANGSLRGFENGNLNSYALNSLALKTYRLPKLFGTYREIKAMNGKVYLLKEHGIEIFDIL